MTSGEVTITVIKKFLWCSVAPVQHITSTNNIIVLFWLYCVTFSRLQQR